MAWQIATMGGCLKILQVGPCPPPSSGWSVRIKFLQVGLRAAGHVCEILNMGKHRRIKSDQYVDVQGGFDYFRKLFFHRMLGFHLHLHMNGQAVKGPILTLLGQVVSLLTFERAVVTFHGGVEQLYFPRRNAGRMYPIIYANLVLAKAIVCNNDDMKRELSDYGSGVSPDKVFPIPAFSVQYLKYDRVRLPPDISTFIASKSHVIVCYVVLRNGFYIDTLVEFLNLLPNDVGVVLTGVTRPEDPGMTCYVDALHKLETRGVIVTVGTLGHDEFMTLLECTSLYLRTPVSDGVASSVLEALSQGVPVVASENWKRPDGVVTYSPGDAEDMLNRVSDVLECGKGSPTSVQRPRIHDTLKDEIDLLYNCFA